MSKNRKSYSFFLISSMTFNSVKDLNSLFIVADIIHVTNEKQEQFTGSQGGLWQKGSEIFLSPR